MPSLDFKEIAQANVASGEQDSFELFAREFLELLGYEILSGPDRGSDLRRDLIVSETRRGIGGETVIRWLVSCKHKAHSGQSVVLNDEPDISDRLKLHNCTGFIGFYSTLPASSLTQKLSGMKTNNPSFESQIFDREKIERILLSSGPGEGIARRFFPFSYEKWSKETFDINLAMSRFGMPQPVTFKLPNEDKVLTLEEVIKLYPQGSQYIFDVFSRENLIFCNNILGITKILKRGGQLEDPPSDYMERRAERIKQELEIMAQELGKGHGLVEREPEGKKTNDVASNKKRSRLRISKTSRKRNRSK